MKPGWGVGLEGLLIYDARLLHFLLMTTDEQPPEGSGITAGELLGKRVLVGITRVDQNDEVVSREELHGRVTEIGNSIHVRLSSGEDYKLPPDTNAFYPAAPGEYRLRTTGEVVVDPDFLSIWTIHPPSDGG